MATDAPASRTLDDGQWFGTLDDDDEEEKEDDEETEEDDDEVLSRNGSVAGASASSAPGPWRARFVESSTKIIFFEVGPPLPCPTTPPPFPPRKHQLS